MIFRMNLSSTLNPFLLTSEREIELYHFILISEKAYRVRLKHNVLFLHIQFMNMTSSQPY